MKSIEEIRQLKDIFEDSIFSIIKYGFGKRNILVVLNEVSIDYLLKIKPYLMKLKKEKSILVISKKNIKSQSLGVDFLNIKLTSVVIYGQEPFKEMTFDNTRLKRQIRYEANKTLINLTNDFLSKKWSWQLKDVLFSLIPRLLPLIVAHLYLKGEKIPNAIPDTINRYIKHNEDAIVLLRIRKDLSKSEMNKLFEEVFDFLEKLVDKV